MKKENSYVLFHAKQGLILFVSEVGVFIVQNIFGPWLMQLGIIVFGICSLTGFIMVLRGNYFKLPIINGLAENINL